MKKIIIGLVIGLSLAGTVTFAAKENKKAKVDSYLIEGDLFRADGSIKKFIDGNNVCYTLQGGNGAGISCLKIK